MDRVAAAYGIPPCANIDAERRALHEQDQQHRFPIHAAEVAYRVDRIWDCTRHLLAYGAGEPVAKVWRNCANDRDAWYRFSEIANSALQAFHVQVDIQPQIRPASLYSVAMLQMINDLAAGGSVRRCANEACRRPFLKQRGRSEYGGHRLHGVKYCNASCAQAQYQREKRRRDKAART
jgi:hypothetical protein